MKRKSIIVWHYVVIGILINCSNALYAPHPVGGSGSELAVLGTSFLGSLAGWSILAKKLYNSSFEYNNPHIRWLLQTLSLIAASPSASFTLSGLALLSGHETDQQTFKIISAPFNYLVLAPVLKSISYLHQKMDSYHYRKIEKHNKKREIEKKNKESGNQH